MTQEVGTLDVHTEITVPAPRAQVWAAVLRVGDWWPHRFRDDGRVALEPWVGGRFLEDWGDDPGHGGGALYGEVTELAPPARLAVTGAMGLRGAVASRWVMELADDGTETLVRLQHDAVGRIDEDTRASYTAGWGEVLGALAAAAVEVPRDSLRGRVHF